VKLSPGNTVRATVDKEKRRGRNTSPRAVESVEMTSVNSNMYSKQFFQKMFFN
jgi:hypothetical protein